MTMSKGHFLVFSHFLIDVDVFYLNQVVFNSIRIGDQLLNTQSSSRRWDFDDHANITQCLTTRNDLVIENWMNRYL